MNLPVDYQILTAKQRKAVREEYTRLQGGNCYYCGESLKSSPHVSVMSLPLNLNLFPKNFLLHSAHLHHDHKTGLTIGSVHARCNGVLWQYHGE